MATKTDPLVHMGTITGGEARELLKSNPVILLPMGSHEDQGPHAPMGDYLLAEKIAELAALQASKAGTRTLVAPVLPYGGADWFGKIAAAGPLVNININQSVQQLQQVNVAAFNNNKIVGVDLGNLALNVKPTQWGGNLAVA